MTAGMALAGSLPKAKIAKGQEFATMQKALATAKRMKPMKPPAMKGQQRQDFSKGSGI